MLNHPDIRHLRGDQINEAKDMLLGETGLRKLSDGSPFLRYMSELVQAALARIIRVIVRVCVCIVDILGYAFYVAIFYLKHTLNDYRYTPGISAASTSF